MTGLPACGTARRCFVAIAILCGVGVTASAYDSTDPTVRTMIDNGVAALDRSVNESTKLIETKIDYGGLGERFLAGYAAMKVNHDENQPAVQKAMRDVIPFTNALGAGPKALEEKNSGKMVYQIAVAVLLLNEVDPNRYMSNLKACERFLRQKVNPGGFYCYPSENVGDISQTQYAMLALWTLDNAGVSIDYKGVAKTINWLLAVQSTDGGWPYRGELSPRGRIKQNGVTPGLAMAGGSALMIAADILDAWENLKDKDDETGIADLPKAIRIYDEAEALKQNAFATKPVADVDRILASIRECDQYLAQHTPDPSASHAEFPYYQVYTQERYESFKELLNQNQGTANAPWYDTGIDFLNSKYTGTTWPGTAHSSSAVSAAFAVLFAIRSTKKSIELKNAGTAKGQYGIPDDPANATLVNGKVKKPSIAESVTSLLDALEDDGADSLDGKSIPDNLKLAPPGSERQTQLDRLERLARGSRSYQARRVAFRLIGQSDSLEMVPTLIFGLSDPDRMARTYARDGLRFISRKFDGYGMDPGANDEEVYNVQRKWKRWYLTMNPSYVFVD